jgi:uncharacterized membrane protein
VLTDADLAGMRAAQLMTLPETATIQRATDTRTAAGGTSQSWASAGTASCRLSSRGVPREYLASGRSGARSTGWSRCRTTQT